MQSNIYVDCSHTDFEGGHGSDASEQSFRSVHDDATSAVSRDEYQDCCSPIVHDGAESESSSARMIYLSSWLCTRRWSTTMNEAALNIQVQMQMFP